MRLVLDLETSGLLKPGVPAADQTQPHIVQLAAILFDPKWRVAGKLVTLIKPDGWTIEREAEAHHGISESRCVRYGIPIAIALAMLQSLVAAALQMIAHNAQFDRSVVEAELARLGVALGWWHRKASSMACTMELSTRPCAIPGDFGFKFPTLEEATARFLPAEPFVTRHDGEEDALQAAKIARALEREGILPPASLRPGPPQLDTSWRAAP